MFFIKKKKKAFLDIIMHMVKLWRWDSVIVHILDYQNIGFSFKLGLSLATFTLE